MAFRPKASFGWVWLVLLGGVMIGSALLGLSTARGLPASVWLIEGAIVLLGLFFLGLALLFPTMSYVVDGPTLSLRYGPMHWEVPLSSIHEVRRADLGWTMWSTMRFPGFALFRVPYAGLGNVRMVATRSIHGVLLMRTDAGLYGVTPADEKAFLDALRTGLPPGALLPEPSL